MTSFNLIPGHRREARRRQRRTRAWAIGCAAYATVLLGAYVLSRATWSGPDSALAGDLVETAAQTEQQSRQVLILRGQIQKARLTLESNRAVGDQPDWSVVLALLARNLDDDLVLKRCKLQPEVVRKAAGSPQHAAGAQANEPERFTLEISGFGRSQKAISQFALRLERTNLFQKVTLVQTNREPFVTGRAMAFQIRCLLGRREEAPR